MEKKITVSRKRAKKLTVSRKKAKILTVNRKSHYPIEILMHKELSKTSIWIIYLCDSTIPEYGQFRGFYLLYETERLIRNQVHTEIKNVTRLSKHNK